MPFELLPVPQLEADLPLIEDILDQTFGLSRRTKTSYRLREGSAPAEGLSFVIRDAEVGIAGCISYWPLSIGKAGRPALLLGPLAVHPKRQNLGIGLKLMQFSLNKALTMGHSLVLLVGDLPYYARVGFHTVPEGQLQLPGPFDPKRFLYLELVAHALSGADGLVLAKWRRNALSPLAEPHGAGGDQQQSQTQQG